MSSEAPLVGAAFLGECLVVGPVILRLADGDVGPCPDFGASFSFSTGLSSFSFLDLLFPLPLLFFLSIDCLSCC